MSAEETFLKRYPDGENYAPHCFEFYETGYLDGEVFQFQIIKSLEQQIQGHVLEVLKLREELAASKQHIRTDNSAVISALQEELTAEQKLRRIFQGAITPCEGEGDLEDQNANLRVKMAQLEDELIATRTDYKVTVAEYEDVIATLRPISEALKTAVELNLTVEAWDYHIDVSINGYSTISEEVREDKLAATIRAITRAAHAIKGDGK